MRLDLYLKASRIVLRRSIAQDLCDAGGVRVNGTKAKSSKEVKAGDELDIKRGSSLMKVRIKEIPGSKQVSKASAPGLYEVLEESRVGDSLLT